MLSLQLLSLICYLIHFHQVFICIVIFIIPNRLFLLLRGEQISLIIFIWSVSGAIITEASASTFPTVIAYVVDTPRSSIPVTFMSNMLYAYSVPNKTRLPVVLAFNKTDVAINYTCGY
ncbi:hypothetical protein I3843_06G041800 [Carya illinoinensis]|nr:hypothetical protein I3843_06G041800 [Carya illinoinensis]